ncbi:MAG: gamma carbonic anhydrase family protein, partial [Candidatus Methanofastidiosia archaeon]
MRIGRYTNIQDNVVVHVDSLFGVKIGDYVTLGHSSVVHGAEIGDNVLVGINSTILNGAEIGSNSIIGANALVPEGMKVPEKSLVLGVPAKVKELKKDVGLIKTYALTYFVLSRGYLRGERVFPPKEFLREVESYIKSI